MGKIIQRDFFPDLEKLKAQNEYLEAVEKNDVQKMRELYAKYSSGNRPPTERYASPATFETPIDIRREDDPARPSTEHRDKESTSQGTHGDIENSEPEPKYGLDAYLSSHTSEDNQSFQEIMHEAEMKHRHKFGWLYEAEDSSKELQRSMLALPSLEEQAIEKPRPLTLETWGYKNKNYVMYVPAGVDPTPEECVEMARRRQQIAHPNTRYVRCPFDERQNKETIQQLAQSQAQSALEGRIGVDGRELTQADGPTVNGFGFVATPSPMPGVNESPLMTWGNIEGTPFRLDGGDTPMHGAPGPSFRIAEPPKREKLALALAEKAGERHRDRKLKAIAAARRQLSTPSPRPGTSLDRFTSMSPAARRLASSHLRRSSLGTDHALLASYSPRPGSKPGTPVCKTPTPSSKKPATPNNKGLTDNLLNIPRRKRAADYF